MFNKHVQSIDVSWENPYPVVINIREILEEYSDGIIIELSSKYPNKQHELSYEKDNTRCVIEIDANIRHWIYLIVLPVILTTETIVIMFIFSK